MTKVDENQDSLGFKEILRIRAAQLGLPESEVAERERQSPPRFMAPAEKRAVRLGLSEQHLKEMDDAALRAAEYPGPDCLDPVEVEHYVETCGLPEKRLKHIESCAPCEALLEAARPSPERAEAFLDEVRRLLARTSAAAAKGGFGG